jgi:hypothetical protein
MKLVLPEQIPGGRSTISASDFCGRTALPFEDLNFSEGTVLSQAKQYSNPLVGFKRRRVRRISQSDIVSFMVAFLKHL